MIAVLNKINKTYSMKGNLVHIGILVSMTLPPKQGKINTNKIELKVST